MKTVPSTYVNKMTSVNAIVGNIHLPALPPINGPHELNAINQWAYALLSEFLFEMSQREVGFCGSLVKANYLTKKQDKWLRDLIKRYFRVDVPSMEAGTVATAA